LPVTEEAGAVKLIENIRKKVGNLEVMGKDGPFSLTISSGIVSLRPKDSLTTEPTELLRAADQALYKAKEEGRNQTWIAREGDMKNGRVIFESRPASQIKP
jgi:diguanylate cyclase (GGDEF)-like protein